MKGKRILLILCAAGVLSCGPIGGSLPGGGQGQPQVPTRGTITIREHSSITQPDSEGEERTTVEHLVTIELVDGRATASISYDETRHAQSHMDNGIIIIDSSLDESTRAEGKSLPAELQVDVREDGAYTISFAVQGIKGTWTHDSEGSGRCVIPSRDCGVPQSGHEHRSAEVYDVGGTSGDITGQVDPHQPRAFSGTTTEIVNKATGAERTTTWDLRGR